ncbi:hypothetical protein EUTSA_v10027453mg [Eutrema salsugineum]|uniref:Knottin scorpion toxin-like domain-containing protein n=1 Tax=Eutrema salsugineum TaxID=72664 RepID=V4MDF8_EUTSA|nr:hypothetical protein EUTSA_v10027453mg [Eutrema salsugineum]
MNKIRYLDVVSTITMILLLVIAEQANAVSVDGPCFGPCTDTCWWTCQIHGFTEYDCAAFRHQSGCCCKTPKKHIFEESAQLNN